MKIIKTALFVVAINALLIMGGCSSNTPMPEQGVSLLGSRWHYADDQWQYDIEFADSGVLLTTHPNDKTKNNDSWEQNGSNVTFYFNNKFSQYNGTVSGDNLMSGTATNTKGASWNWKASRAD